VGVKLVLPMDTFSTARRMTAAASETPAAGVPLGGVSFPSTGYQKKFYAHKIPPGPKWIPPPRPCAPLRKLHISVRDPLPRNFIMKRCAPRISLVSRSRNGIAPGIVKK
jgi:hypothetical protein